MQFCFPDPNIYLCKMIFKKSNTTFMRKVCKQNFVITPLVGGAPRAQYFGIKMLLNAKTRLSFLYYWPQSSDHVFPCYLIPFLCRLRSES